MRRFLASMLLAFAALPAGAEPAPPVPLVILTQIATLNEPVALAVRAGDPALYVAEKQGVVRAIRGGVVDPVPALDITDLTDSEGEKGLLGLAFSPDGGRMYVNYTDVSETSGDTHVDELAMSGGVALRSTRRQVLFVEQPFANHNGGMLAFGPDGYLYVALGDGGSGGDPLNSGQRLDTLLGKILRIDPLSATPYAIPPGNPFVSTPGARPEIWAYGLRNPWRFSFDRLTGDTWIGDVGQNLWEEIDFVPRSAGGGQNYGWNCFEATHQFRACSPPIANHTPPVYEYPHDGARCSVTGGYVYRGTRIPALQGRYVFADFCAGRLQALTAVGPLTLALDLLAVTPFIASFGEDAAGEIYVLSLEGGVFRLDPAL